MVSFQCEGCGDVQTKKKLDSHRNHCHAPFTCIDCMTTFRGTEYRSHTSCMTEDQKYQGHLYREKPTKANKRKSVSILEPTDANAVVPHKAYVEDAPDFEIPPEVPTPPPAVPNKSADSVFDYLVEDEPQGTPKITFTDRKDAGEMAMKNDAPSVFSRPTSQNDYRNEEERSNNNEYETNGFSYGIEPVNPRPLDMNGSSLSLDFMTPAAKVTKAILDKKDVPSSVSHSRTNSGSEKKRKRASGDDHSSTDTTMLDAPETIVRSVVDTPGIIHSGLTGGLSRMVTNDQEFPSPYNRSPSTSPVVERGPTAARQTSKREDPASPLKRTRRSKDDSNGLGISIKGRAGKVLSMVGGALVPTANTGDTKTRRRASSSDHATTTRSKEKDIGEKRDRKKHKVTRHNGTSPANVRFNERPSSRRPHAVEDQTDEKRKMKAIEYNPKNNEYSNSDSDEAAKRGGNNQMVVFGAEEEMRLRCESFLSYVTKGSHSERGYSVNKALKRWHRDREVHGTSGKIDEEKELWRGLRLRRNDRGEVVVFF